MNEAHIVVGVAAIAVNALAAVWGGWVWWRMSPSRSFWRLVRVGQAAVVLEAVLGGIDYVIHPHVPGLHVLYGLLPLVVSLLAEGLRASSAQMVLDKHGYASAQEVGEQPESAQRAVVSEILRREAGAMALAALVVVALLARAAGTG